MTITSIAPRLDGSGTAIPNQWIITMSDGTTIPLDLRSMREIRDRMQSHGDTAAQAFYHWLQTQLPPVGVDLPSWVSDLVGMSITQPTPPMP